jgi:hypothetical protein
MFVAIAAMKEAAAVLLEEIVATAVAMDSIPIVVEVVKMVVLVVVVVALVTSVLVAMYAMVLAILVE